MPLPTGLLTMVVAQLFDLGTFVTMIRRLGASAEANPLVLAELGSGGLPVLVLAKLCLIVLIGALSVALMSGQGPRARVAGQLLLSLGIVAGLIGGWSNAVTMGPL